MVFYLFNINAEKQNQADTEFIFICIFIRKKRWIFWKFEIMNRPIKFISFSFRFECALIKKKKIEEINLLEMLSKREISSSILILLLDRMNFFKIFSGYLIEYLCISSFMKWVCLICNIIISELFAIILKSFLSFLSFPPFEF